MTERVAADALASGETGFVGLLRAALESWLDTCEAPEVQRILLLDGPSELGWTRWRELCQPYVIRLVEDLVRQGVDDGTIEPLPIRPLAHALVAMADEAALYVVSAPDPETARAEMTIVLERLASSLAVKSVKSR